MDGARAVPPPAHIVLRESTRAAHEAAEASPVMQRLLAGELDEGGYRSLLEAQWGLLEGWESERWDWLTEIGPTHHWRYLSRATALKRDLTPERDSAPERDLAPERDRAPVGARPARDSLSRKAAGPVAHGLKTCRAQGALLQAWGELYVIEGSALGGRIIVKHLRERFPALPHHFYAIGENADEPWPRFQSVLDRVLAEPAALQAAIDGALRMFARFQQTLQDDAAHV
ncbi:biliverdin-producing heme oxygenase [Luteibacter sp.]|uniref:biliverdin-producing heme oxygenase n=1 Tax=Luteibacter sp. TaxID=1886636 RepID=UPI002F41BB70